MAGQRMHKTVNSSQKNANMTKIKFLQTYAWDFCREKFKSLYPTETVY